MIDHIRWHFDETYDDFSTTVLLSTDELRKFKEDGLKLSQMNIGESMEAKAIRGGPKATFELTNIFKGVFWFKMNITYEQYAEWVVENGCIQDIAKEFAKHGEPLALHISQRYLSGAENE